MASEIVLVDDEPDVLELQKDVLRTAGLPAEVFTDAVEAWNAIRTRPGLALVVTDYDMPKMNGLDLFFNIRGLPRPPYVIILTGKGTIDLAVRAMNEGAFHFLQKPLDITQYVQLIRSALARFHGSEAVPLVPDGNAAAEAPQPVPPSDAGRERSSSRIEPARTSVTREGREPVIQAPAMRRVFDVAASTAAKNASVLLLGESGVGKEVLADFIHAHSLRARGPIVKVNCGALPENLMESELFGHEKGSFTGAIKRRVGRFEQAHGGTLFLDEIGDLLLPLQTKLLRAIQEKVIEPVGSSQPIPTDFRLICATNQDLNAAVKKGTFREDLYYRINVIPIGIPPLRERREEIEALALYFFAILRQGQEGPAGFAPEALERLRNFPWPGNVRQLRNAIEYALVVCRGELIGVQDLPQDVREHDGRGDASVPRVSTSGPLLNSRGTENLPVPPSAVPRDSGGLKESLSETTAKTIVAALERNHWRMTHAARELQISRSSLYERIKKFGIKRPD